MLTRPGRLVLLLMLVLSPAVVLGALPTAPAWAGRYHVYSCRMPDGTPIPAEGWKGTETGTERRRVEQLPAGRRARSRRCSEARGGSRTGPARRWEFSPPAGDQLVGATLWRAGDVGRRGNPGSL